MAIVRFLFKLLLSLLLLLALIGVFLPRQVTVERSTIIDASANQIFPHINSMKVFHQWSPWRDVDPNTEYSFEGPNSGVDSKMSWRSTVAEVGTGSQVITRSVPDRKVVSYLEFGDQGDGIGTIDLYPAGSGTKVTWEFQTDFGWNLIDRYFGLMLDSLLGPSYEQGLANLKQRVERITGG